jgi:transcription initiation factor TFIIIB Brf1 subunit/transcription initiation factor TFIIB
VLHTAESHKYIWLSTAAIYLACQLEEKRKTEAEICKVTGPRIGHTTQSVQRTFGELG